MTVNWSLFANTSVLVNLLSQFQTNQFTKLQGVFIDNSTNLYPVTVTCVENSLSFTCPGMATATFPLITGPAPELVISTTQDAFGGKYLASTRLYFINTPAKPFCQEQDEFGPVPLFSATQPLASSSPNAAVLNGQPGLHYAINSLDISLSAFGSFAAAAAGFLELYEQATSGAPNTGGNYARLWSTQWACPPGTTQPFYARQVVFPAPIVQKTAGNPIWLYSSNVTNSLQTTLNVTFGLLTIA